ncbi:MAG: glutamate 5-kinase [Candidatus Aureabacteria bacterium]|nr:glutamate 5-kinase [Candidatus Auribacterota bacterium]
MRKHLENVKSLTLKIGTNVLTDSCGRIQKNIISSIVRQVCEIREKGVNVMIISSGAIAAGRWKLEFGNKELTLRQKQAAAAVGQTQLMRYYEDAFAEEGVVTAQVLLTDDGLSDRKRQLNAKNTLLTLIEKKAVPIINENDTVSVEEIKFGDNDRLSALVAQMTGSELLILLTDTEGLMDKDPKVEKNAKRISIVNNIDVGIEKICGGKGSYLSTGGMYSKIQAAKMVVDAGEFAVIANGKKQNIISDILAGKDVGTLFLSSRHKMKGKKRWIAHFKRSSGFLVIDAGAVIALKDRGKSLLASGITSVKGDFSAGDIVILKDERGNDIGKGQVNYSSGDARKIAGLKTSQIRGVFGGKVFDEVVHRNNMVIYGETRGK